MSPKQRLRNGNRFPYDASDEWWDGDGRNTPSPTDWAISAARGVIYDLQNRVKIKYGFDDIEEAVRVEIVTTLAAIIRAARGEK